MFVGPDVNKAKLQLEPLRSECDPTSKASNSNDNNAAGKDRRASSVAPSRPPSPSSSFSSSPSTSSSATAATYSATNVDLKSFLRSLVYRANFLVEENLNLLVEADDILDDERALFR